jgi:5-methylcytosine-specific restriction endonuclease McrA
VRLVTDPDARAARNAAQRAYYQRTRTTAVAKVMAYQRAHPEKKRIADATYRARHADAIREYRRAYRVHHRDRLQAKGRAYYARNAHRWTERQRKAWRDAPEVMRAKKRAQYRRSAKLRENGNRYAHERRARMYAVAYEPFSRLEILVRDGGRCFHCGTELTGPWDMDHLVPLSRGGPHIRSNVVASCRSCNRKRHSRVWEGASLPINVPLRPRGHARLPGASNPRVRFNRQLCEEIQRLYQAGVAQADIAQRCRLSAGTVNRILRGHHWSGLPPVVRRYNRVA